MTGATLEAFEAKFRADPDPWRTFSGRDEAFKRGAILHALGGGRAGRMLELGCGNGSNSVVLARRALALDSTDGSAEAVRLTSAALSRAAPGCQARVLALPGRFPRPTYDAVVVAELLYYLTPRAMRAVARDVNRALSRGGVLVLAHHHVDFHDFAQPAAGLHARFIAATGARWRGRAVIRTARWTVEAWRRLR